MGWQLQLCAFVLFSIAFPSSSVQRQKAARNVTADELLAYGVVIHQLVPTDSSVASEGATCDPLPESRPKCSPSQDSQTSRSQTADHDSSGLRTQASSVAERGGGSKTAGVAAGRLSDSDFVFTAGTCMKRIRLAAASRAWRRSPAVRAFFLTDSRNALPGLNARGAAEGEAYGFFPSEGAPELGGWTRSLRAGDTRAAAAPFAAHRHFGDTYKWMLYGDDDTVFFLDAVEELVGQLDPDLPWALSDNLWSANRHPNPNAPRCLPCHMANETLPSLEQIFTSVYGRVDIRATYQQWRGGKLLPISQAEYRAFAVNTTQVPGQRYLPVPACPSCSRESACEPVAASGSAAPCSAPTAHGGAGMIFSVGLLRALPYRDMLACFLTITDATGGDHMVSECLWRHGFAFTDPGPVVRHTYDNQYVVFGGAPRLPSLLGIGSSSSTSSSSAAGGGGVSGGVRLAGVAGGGRCNELCRWMLQHVVSVHLHARLVKDLKALVALQEELPGRRDAALRRIASRQHRGTEEKGGPPPLQATPGPEPS